MTTHLVWFRADLRVNDNLALAAACRDPDARVIGLFIATPQQWRDHTLAPRQAAFIHQNLEALQQALAKRALRCLRARYPISPPLLTRWPRFAMSSRSRRSFTTISMS